MRTVVFINAHSRQGAENVTSVKRALSRPGNDFDVAEYIVVDNLDSFNKKLKRLRSHKDAECVIVGSGDGTIIAILNELKDRRDIVYGFLPLGTSNTFVRSLGLPGEFRPALKVIKNRNVRTVSLGSINGRLFANIADIGVPAKVADNLTNRVKKHLGPAAYVVSGLRELAHHNAIWCELKVNGKTESFYTHNLFVANGKYRGPIALSDDASAFTNKLTLGYSASKGRLDYLKDALKFLSGGAKKHDNISLIPIEKATLTTKPIQKIQADGEVIGKTPAKINIVKDAIRVFTVPEAQDRPRKQRKNSH